MKLKFFGRGAGFSDFETGHTSAFFEYENDLILIDCPMTAFYKLRKMDLSKYENIQVYITHTHGDHVGGLGLVVQHCKFVLNKELKITAPNDLVARDIETLLCLEGNQREWFYLLTYDTRYYNYPFIVDVVKTKHSPQLPDRCFGYVLNIDDTVVIYTGDTSTLEPFEKYIAPGRELYVDTSVYYGQIHIKLEYALPDFISYANNGVKVYLMHLDDVEKAKEIVRTYNNIEVVDIAEV